MPPPPPQGPALRVENWFPYWRSWPGRIGEELVAGGLDPATPAAVIQQGTVRGQRLLLSSLGELADQVEAQGFASPSIVVVGEVVAQRVEACAPEPADAELPIPF